MTGTFSPERVRERAFDLYFRVALTGSAMAAVSGFGWMWLSWIKNLHIVGFAIGWFFGLQVGVIFFVVAVIGFAVIGCIAAGLLELGLLIARPRSPAS